MPDDANEYEILPIPSYQQPVIHNDKPVDPWPQSVFNSKFVNGILDRASKDIPRPSREAAGEMHSTFNP